MEPALEKKSGLAQLKEVTPVSKVLATIILIVLPFLGGWIGYTYAPEKLIEVEKVVERTSPKGESKNENSSLVNSNGTSSIFTFFEDISANTEEADEILFIEDDSKNLSGTFEWGTPLPYFTVKATEISRSIDPNCEYGCQPTVMTSLDYYSSSPAGWIKFYSEEMEVGNIQKITYLLLEETDDSGKFRFIQNINRGFCCDGGGSISNRLFEVNLSDRRTIITSI
jgi:hypothetical protein